ncbi:guanine nucleotide-binding protein subunit alpha, partial [Cladochytrium tenue]
FATSEIAQTTFIIEDTQFVIYDVGGQRSMRQFWAPYLEKDLTAVIFVADISSYDQLLQEDNTGHMSMIIGAVKDIVLTNSLKYAGLL